MWGRNMLVIWRPGGRGDQIDVVQLYEAIINTVKRWMACHPDACSSSIIVIMNYSVDNKHAEFIELDVDHSYYIATSGVERKRTPSAILKRIIQSLNRRTIYWQ